MDLFSPVPIVSPREKARLFDGLFTNQVRQFLGFAMLVDDRDWFTMLDMCRIVRRGAALYLNETKEEVESFIEDGLKTRVFQKRTNRHGNQEYHLDYNAKHWFQVHIG